MGEHTLRTWPEFWDAIHDGRKTFEMRRADRDYKVGDTLCLRRWDQVLRHFTHPTETIRCEVTYVMTGGQFGLRHGFVCMGIRVIEKPEVSGG